MAAETPGLQASSSADDPHFANQAEVECARILDFYGLEWEVRAEVVRPRDG